MDRLREENGHLRVIAEFEARAPGDGWRPLHVRRAYEAVGMVPEPVAHSPALRARIVSVASPPMPVDGIRVGSPGALRLELQFTSEAEVAAGMEILGRLMLAYVDAEPVEIVVPRGVGEAEDPDLRAVGS